MKPPAATNPFRIINIIPLFTGHKAEIAADQLRLERECGITEVAPMLPLNPEEAVPSLAKAEYLRDRFLEMREALRAAGSTLPVGLLMQSLIGHGTHTAAPFQRLIRADGTTNNRMCPLDPGFKAHIRAAVRTVAATRPAFLLVDDDFRLFLCGYGCFCPLHLAGFNQRIGGNYDRESLLAVLNQTDPEARRVGDAWTAWLLESLVGLARDVRAGIDDVDPELPCGYCTPLDGPGSAAFVVPVARAVAGRQPPFVRINNSWYLGNDARGVLDRLHPTALNVALLQAAGITDILSESDTFPHNRYSTPARAIHAHLVFSILHGVTGAKLWVTRMFDHEPASGEAYREVLGRQRGLRDELFRLMPAVRWDEPATPLPTRTVSPWNPADYNKERLPSWATAVCGHMGIPCRIGGGPAAVAMLTGPETELFSDAELTALLAKGLLLDGGAAERLCRRGFAEYLGVEADAPAGRPVNFERLAAHPINGSLAGNEVALASFFGSSVRRLTVREPGVQLLSTAFSLPWYMSPDPVAEGPAVTLFENRLGGRVAVYAAALDPTDNFLFLTYYYTFMNETRRGQLIHILDWLNRAPLPAVALTDANLYARHGVIANAAGGGELLALFNLNMDDLPEFRLRLAGPPPARIAGLTDAGAWADLPWRADSATGEVTIAVPLETMIPRLLRIQRHSEP
jgi:hypothetical protein